MKTCVIVLIATGFLMLSLLLVGCGSDEKNIVTDKDSVDEGPWFL